MAKVQNIMPTVIFIKDSLSMGLRKGLDNISGLTALTLRGISNKDIEMVMEFGNQKEANSNIKAIICLIENMDLVYMIGETTLFTKVNILKT